MHGDEVADGDDDGRGAQELLIGEAELHAEEQRKVYCHACEACVEEHEQVLNHKACCAADRFKGSEVYAAAELYAEDGEDIYPWLKDAWYPWAEHGHGEDGGGGRCLMHGVCVKCMISVKSVACVWMPLYI